MSRWINAGSSLLVQILADLIQEKTIITQIFEVWDLVKVCPSTELPSQKGRLPIGRAWHFIFTVSDGRLSGCSRKRHL
jgi:hypothetical protein